MADNNTSTTANNLTMAHQPANIVGGRRVGGTTHRNESTPLNQDALREVLDSGLPAKMSHAYPTEAVKRTHEKPTPAVQVSHVNRGTSGGAQRFIPSKQNH